MIRAFVTAVAGIALVLAGCASDTDGGGGGSGMSESPSATSSTPTAMGNGALFVLPYQGSGGQRYAIGADGTVGSGAPVPWESGPDAEATLLKDALGPWALTATVELPLTDVSRTKQVQVRDVETGEVLHQIDVPGWCSGPDGASYPCLLLDENRMVRTTPIDGERSGSITISSTETAETLAEYGPFPALGGVLATSSPDAVILVAYGEPERYTVTTLDTRTGATALIGSLPLPQPVICTLGSDSVLTYASTLQVLGPASAAPVAIPELGDRGPGAQGCSADGTHLYVGTGSEADMDGELAIDAVSLPDGSRAPAVTLPAAGSAIWVTR